MIRLPALFALCVLLTGCMSHKRQGPFGKQPAKQPPPPYGSVTPPGAQTAAPPKSLGNQSPLGMASADPAPPLPPDENSLIPPRTDAIVPAGGALPGVDGTWPPFRNRPEPRPGALPSPFAPKDQPGVNTPGSPGPAPSPAAKNLGELKALVASASAAWKAVDTYEATLTRREVNPKGEVNSEVLLFQYRKEPMSVFTRNTGEMGKGREMVYNPKKYDDKLHVMLGQGDNRLMKAGFVAPPISPDDPRVKEKARYSIRDAGFGTPINKLAGWVAKLEAGKIPADALTYDGPVNRTESLHPLVGVTHKLRIGDDPLLPNGGTRKYFFDMKRESPAYGLPLLVIATDAMGKEVEYYSFEKIKSPANLTDADFNPERLEKKK